MYTCSQMQHEKQFCHKLQHSTKMRCGLLHSTSCSPTDYHHTPSFLYFLRAVNTDFKFLKLHIKINTQMWMCSLHTSTQNRHSASLNIIQIYNMKCFFEVLLPFQKGLTYTAWRSKTSLFELTARQPAGITTQSGITGFGFTTYFPSSSEE